MLPSLADLRPLAAELLLAAGLLVVLLADLVLPAARKHLLGWLSAGLVALVFVATFFLPFEGQVMGGAYVGSAWGLFFKRLFLGAAFMGILGALEHLRRAMPHRQGEYYLLLLFSVLGMMVLPGARDLIVLVVAFELMGIPLYLMAAYGKSDAAGEGEPAPTAAVVRPGGGGTALLSPAAEAGLKYYLIGAASTTALLMGAGLLAGVAGGTRLDVIAQQASSPVLMLGVVLVLGGMGFKLGAAPFHMWVPDTYQGAHAPFVAFLSVAPKAAGIAAIGVLFSATLEAHRATWLPVVLVMSLASMVVGSFFALPQQSTKRLLGFSGVAQIGYVLLGLAVGTQEGATMVLFYLGAYVATNVGALLVVHAVSAHEGGDSLDGFEGLGRRSPWLAAALLMLLLSLAGIPFVVGFWAKLYVFTAALKAGLAWVVVAGAVLAIVSLFYYLRIVKAMYMAPPRSEESVPVSPALAVAIGLSVALTVGLGLVPAPLLAAAARATQLLFGAG